MSHTNATLQDVLEMVPCLLPCCLHAWTSDSESEGKGLRILHLVSKEIDRIALTGVTSCTVCIGEAADPDPKQLVRLMAHAQLTHMKLIITACTGHLNPSMSQLVNCNKQMDLLLTNLRNAIRSVTELEIEVKQQGSETSKTADDLCYLTACNAIPGCEKLLEHFRSDTAELTREVCSRLAPALPCLQILSLTGHCRDVALGVFGSNCPHFKRLEIQAVTVEAGILQGVAEFLSELEHLTVTDSEETKRVYEAASTFINNVLPLLHDCKCLTTLEIFLDPGDYNEYDLHSDWDRIIRSSKAAWDALPASITDFTCDVAIEWPDGGTRFLQQLRYRTVSNFSDAAFDLPEIFYHSPELQKLSILRGDSSAELLWDVHFYTSPPTAEAPSKFKTQLSGIELCSQGVTLTGASDLVLDVISWLSPMKDITLCEIELHGDVSPDFSLHKLAFAFPSMQHLTLSSKLDSLTWTYALVKVDAAFLKSIEGCRCLETIDLHWTIQHTVAGLVDLFISIPTLTGMYRLPPDQNACYDTAMTQLRVLGRQVKITTLDEEEQPVQM